MRGPRHLFVLTRFLALASALAVLAGGCTRQAPQYVMIDAATGQQVGVVAAAPQPAPNIAPNMAPMVAQARAPAPRAEGRGLFSSRPAAPRPAPPPAYYPPAVMQAPGPAAAAPAPRYAQSYPPQSYATQAYAAAPATYQEPYTLDAGDKLRIVVFGQDGITSSYLVDAGGNVTLPLIGVVPARGLTTAQLAQSIAARLKQGYVRDPKVTAEVEVYRPFFILGEVTTPGQYAYTPNMTAQTAVAIAGGFGPRASKSTVKVTRNIPGQQFSGDVPLTFALKPGDTVLVKERWF